MTADGRGRTADPAAIRYGRDEVEFGRALAFFDATFAIATTLLAATLNPGREGWSSWAKLIDSVEGPLQAFAISFWVIASYWWANHRFVASLRILSPRLVVGTIVLLAFVVVLPITTEGLGTEGASAEVTTIVYAVNVILVSSTEWVLYRIALTDDLFMTRPSSVEVSSSTVAQLVPAVVFLLSIPVALVGAPVAARFVWLSLAVVGPLAGRWANRRVAAAASATRNAG
jgi:uncharacterized membrane protein